MSKTIIMNGWTSQVPNYMYEHWIRMGYIKRNSWNFVDYKFKRTWKSIFISRIKRTMCEVKEEDFNKMYADIKKWYDEIFNYVIAWLTECGYIKLKKGSFTGGFCATPKEDYTTRDLDAPLAEEGNKVIQIKEKFGRIVVYTDNLTVKQEVDLAMFEKYVSEKYDCCANFC